MKRYFLRGLSVFLVVLVLCSCIAVPASAAGASGTTTFWDASARFVSPLYGFISAYLEDDVTPETATENDLLSAYVAYCMDLRNSYGATRFSGNGYYVILWPDWSNYSLASNFQANVSGVKTTQNSLYFVEKGGGGLGNRIYPFPCIIPTSMQRKYGTPVTAMPRAYLTFYEGAYSFVNDGGVDASLYSAAVANSNGAILVMEGPDGVSLRLNKSVRTVVSAGWGFDASSVYYNLKTRYERTSVGTSFVINTPAYILVEPIDFNLDTALPVETRTGSSASTYGYYGDGGELIVGESVKLVDETNNTVFNPVTNTTTNITDWAYDYSDRSYHATTTTGDAITVTYGDENVTIQEGDVTYNVYYVTDGGGTNPDPTPDPGACTHDYVTTIGSEPTCLTAGSKTLACSKCKDTKTEKIPATGHTWVVERTVQTAYDDQGNMVQQGYTIYKCSVCGEQYKDMTGAGPPGSEDAEEKESLWDKIKNFFGSLTGGIFDAIVTVVGAIVDGITKIVEKINEKIGVVIEAALKIFSSIPKLFTGFVEFLTAGFAFLPPEVVMIIEFGLLAVIAVAVIKIFL